MERCGPVRNEGRARRAMRHLPLVASVAIVVAVGGTGIAGAAGTSAPFPFNSVTSRHVKDGALTWADLSPALRTKLLGANAKSGQGGASGPAGATGPAGPQGPAGEAGATGAAGAAGPQGIQGPPGVDGADGADGADGIVGAISATNSTDAALTGSFAPVVTTSASVTSGRSYLIFGSVKVVNGGGGNTLYCRPRINGNDLPDRETGDSMVGNYATTISFTIAVTATETGPVAIACTAPGSMTFERATVTAVEVASISG